MVSRRAKALRGRVRVRRRAEQAEQNRQQQPAQQHLHSHKMQRQRNHVQQLHQPHGSRQRNGIHCGIRIHDDLKRSFHVCNCRANQTRNLPQIRAPRPAAVLACRCENGRPKRRQSKRGTFWTVFLQFELEKAKLSPAANPWSVTNNTSACDEFNYAPDWQHGSSPGSRKQDRPPRPASSGVRALKRFIR